MSGTPVLSVFASLRGRREGSGLVEKGMWSVEKENGPTREKRVVEELTGAAVCLFHRVSLGFNECFTTAKFLSRVIADLRSLHVPSFWLLRFRSSVLAPPSWFSLNLRHRTHGCGTIPLNSAFGLTDNYG